MLVDLLHAVGSVFCILLHHYEICPHETAVPIAGQPASSTWLKYYAFSKAHSKAQKILPAVQ